MSSLVPKILETRLVNELNEQSRTQSPHALWPAVCRRGRFWGTGILLPQDFCGKIKTMQSRYGDSQSKKNFFSNSPESLLATNRWPKSQRTLYIHIHILFAAQMK